MARSPREKVSEAVRSAVASDAVLEALDGTEVFHKEPGKEYRWLNKAEHNVNRKQLMQGWKVVDGESPVEAGIRQPDGTRVSGDVVLAERPISVGDQQRARITLRRKRMEGEPARNFHEAAEMANRESRDAGFTGAGVSTFKTNEGGEDEGVVVKPHRKTFPGADLDEKGDIVQ